MKCERSQIGCNMRNIPETKAFSRFFAYSFEPFGTTRPQVRILPPLPSADELVPSHYAVKVGAIEVMVVSDGVLSLLGAMLGHNADPAVRSVWLEDNFHRPELFEWALNVVVVRGGGRTIHRRQQLVQNWYRKTIHVQSTSDHS